MTDRAAASRWSPDGSVSISPGKTRYLARTVRGDVTKDGAWVEFLTGSTDGSDAASVAARVFTTGRSSGRGTGPNHDTIGVYSNMRWLTEDVVAFLWSDSRGLRQVVQLNLRTGEHKFLTAHPTSIAGFEISAGGLVLYLAQAPEPDISDEYPDGLVVPSSADAFSLFRGIVDGTSGRDRMWNTQWFLKRSENETVHLRPAGLERTLFPAHSIAIAPNGLLAVIESTPNPVPSEWDHYTEADMRASLVDARRDPRAMKARMLKQYFLVDLRTTNVEPLWTAGHTSSHSKLVWSPDSTSLLIAPAFLPAALADEAGLSGTAAVVLNVQSRQFDCLPLSLSGVRIGQLRWILSDCIEFDLVRPDERTITLERSNSGWRERSADAGNAEAPSHRFSIEQDINTPPRLVMTNVSTAAVSMLHDPNPQLLRKLQLSKMEIIHGEANGITWDGLLCFPVDHDPSLKYPLVIQPTYSAPINSEFTLYGYQGGYGLGPTLIAPSCGRLFASRGMFSLQLVVSKGDRFGNEREGAIRQLAIEAAARELVRRGLVDERRVGLVGFSRNGYHVEYTAVNSTFPFAAIVAADNWDAGYVAATLLGYGTAFSHNGRQPFGEGIHDWVRNAPGFNIERITAPLLKVEQSNGLFGVLVKWENFQRLNYLRKPVEFYIMPDSDRRGSHNPQNPSQIIAIQERCIDWLDFWLRDHEDPDPVKLAQYARWREMRKTRGKQTTDRPVSAGRD